jgi:uncharacterized protein YegJ (DUF2314 family)
MRYVLLALCLMTGCSAPADTQTIVERALADEITVRDDEDPAMQAAFKKARDSLDAVFQKTELSDLSVKVGVKEDGNTEYFWLNDLSRTGNRFSGVINNEPRIVTHVRFGQRYEFGHDQIVDWTYVDAESGKMQGNFTGCALLSHEPPEQAAEFRRQYGLDCDT